MKVTSAALRLRASMPTAPVPAKTSRKREPTTPGPRTLKSVSRRRSLVGCSARPFRLFRMRLRYLPAMMRMVDKVSMNLPWGLARSESRNRRHRSAATDSALQVERLQSDPDILGASHAKCESHVQRQKRASSRPIVHDFRAKGVDGSYLSTWSVQMGAADQMAYEVGHV